MDVQVLGGFEVAVDGRTVDAARWEGRRAADVVKLLALREDHRMPREEMVEALWPERPPEAGLANLHKAAHLARKAMGDTDAVVLRGGEIRLAPAARVEVDAVAFEKTSDPDRYGGELLPADRAEEWTQRPREHLRARYLHALRAQGRLAELVDEDPADEPAQRELMRSALQAGDPQAGLRRYRDLARALAELGLRPGEETEALRRELARGPAVNAPLTDTTPLVGRERELDEALGAWRRAAGGNGGALLVSGEAGIGKTRLCEAVLAHAEQAGWTTLRGAATGEGAAPYTPVCEALDRLLIGRPDLSAQLTDVARSELTRLSAAAPDPPAPGDAGPDRQRMFSAAAQLLAAAAGERGVVLLLDDLHDADAGSLALAHFLARAARFQPLLVVASYRDSSATPELAALRSALLDQRDARELELRPLTRRAADDLVRSAAPRPPGEGTLDTVWALARGHPFFTAELGAAIGADGTVEVPGRLYEVLHARLSRLDPAVRDALARLAIAGDTFERGDLVAIGGLDPGAVDATLDAAMRAGTVAAAGTGYRFRHALVRQALAGRLPAHRAAEVHHQVARRLVAEGAGAGRVAEHLLAAHRPAEAIPWLVRAAREAAGVAAWSDALRLLDRALELDGGDGLRAELLPLRADLLVATGDPSAPAAYSEALGSAAPHERFALRLRQARAFLNVGDVAAATAALGGLVADDEAGEAQLLLVRGMVAWFCGQTDEARAAGSRARELAIRAGLGRETTLSTQLQAAVAHSDGSWSAHLQAEMTTTFGLPDLQETVFDAHLCISEYVLASGVPYERLIAAAADLREGARRTGARRVDAFATTVIGEAEQLRGQLRAADRHLRDAIELNREIGAASVEALARLRLGEVALASGRRREGLRLIEEALGLARFSPIADHLLYPVYAAMITAAPDEDAALAVLGEAEASLEAFRSCFFCPIAYTVAATHACARAGQTERARAYLAASRQRCALWTAGSWPAAVREADASVALAEGEAGRASALLGEAAELFARAGQPLNRARVVDRLASLRA